MTKLQLNPFAVEHRRLHTGLRPDECKAALETAARTSWWGTYREDPAGDDSSPELSAQVIDNHFTLNVVSGWPFFKKMASGTFSAVPDGTAIAVRVAPDSESSGRGLAFLLGLLAIPLVCGSAVPRGEALTSWVFTDPLPRLTVSVLLVLGGYLLSRWLNQNDGELLVIHLREALEAEEA
jgi:hypothetical protein